MTINGGVYEGGVFVVKNGDWDGEMTINGGTFAIRDTTAGKASNWGAVVSNSNNCTMTITGGVFNGAAEGKDPVVKAKTKSAADEGNGLTITGGTFSGPSDVLQTLNKASGASPDAIINVQSGNFTGTINQNTKRRAQEPAEAMPSAYPSSISPAATSPLTRPSISRTGTLPPTAQYPDINIPQLRSLPST
jgi:hypothetical protein